jgi:hypothetical protein
LTSVGSIRADVSKRLLIPAALTALLTAACGSIPSATGVDYGSGPRFVTAVMDSLDNVGQGSAVAVDANGTVFASYFGFPAETKDGAVPPARPIGSPFLPGVLLSSVDSKGMVTHGAVQQTKPSVAPTGIGVPFGPDTPDTLDLTPENANGTDVAVGSDGSIHVVWTAASGVYYSKTMPGMTSTVDQIYDYGASLKQAGPVGRPSIALGAGDTPWVAFGVNGQNGIEIHVATPGANGWDDTVAASTGTCNGCPQPLPTGIAVVKGSPVIAFGDVSTNTVMAATLQGKRWTTSQVETDASGAGLDMSAAADTAYVSYYTGNGAVHVATFDGATWSSSEVAKAADPATTSGLAAPNTAVAADDQGALSVAWEDAGVHLASGSGGTFQEVATEGTGDGRAPALAAAGGFVYLTWYNATSQDLMLGVQGDVSADLYVANPSPAPTISLAPAGNTECGADGKIALDIIAKGIAWDTNCLVAPAGEKFTINVDNQDAGVPHNFDALTEQGGTELGKTEIAAGPIKQTLDLGPLDAGTYFFQCDVHPTTMIGTLAVIDTKATK